MQWATPSNPPLLKPPETPPSKLLDMNKPYGAITELRKRKDQATSEADAEAAAAAAEEQARIDAAAGIVPGDALVDMDATGGAGAGAGAGALVAKKEGPSADEFDESALPQSARERRTKALKAGFGDCMAVSGEWVWGSKAVDCSC